MARDLGEAFSNIGAGLMARAEKERERKLLEEERKRLKEEEEAAWKRKEQFLATLKQQEADAEARKPKIRFGANGEIIEYARDDAGALQFNVLREATQRPSRPLLTEVDGNRVAWNPDTGAMTTLGPVGQRQGTGIKESNVLYWQAQSGRHRASVAGIDATLAALREQIKAADSLTKPALEAQRVELESKRNIAAANLKEAEAMQRSLGGNSPSTTEVPKEKRGLLGTMIDAVGTAGKFMANPDEEIVGAVGRNELPVEQGAQYLADIYQTPRRLNMDTPQGEVDVTAKPSQQKAPSKMEDDPVYKNAFASAKALRMTDAEAKEVAEMEYKLSKGK